jgi:hypothetical protein
MSFFFATTSGVRPRFMHKMWTLLLIACEACWRVVKKPQADLRGMPKAINMQNMAVFDAKQRELEGWLCTN